MRSIGAFQTPTVASVVRERLEHDPAGQVRLAAIDVLGKLDGVDAVAVLEPLTASPDADIARAAIRGLGHARDQKAKDVLDVLLRSGDTFRRLEAVAATGSRDEADAASTLQWVAAADSNRDVVNEAIAALARLAVRAGPAGIAGTRALVGLIAEAAHREMVVTALSGLPARRIEEVAKGLGYQSPEVRRATIETLGRMKNPEASRWIETALDDRVPSVRVSAVAELRRLGSAHASKKLLKLARTDPDLEVRHAATMAVTQRRSDALPDHPDTL